MHDTGYPSLIINPNKERAHLLVSRRARNVRANLILSMAIYHLTVKTGSRHGGQSALAKSEYIEREGKYELQDDERAHRESDNMPEWAEEDPRSYWEAADAHERANGRLFREVEFALPRELNEGEQVDLAREFARRLTRAGRGAAALHAGPCIAVKGRTPTPT